MNMESFDASEHDEQLQRFLFRLFGSFESKQDSREGSGEYVFFRDEEERRQLVEYCERITEYLHDEKVADLVIIDRSSRPVYIGVMEFWKNKFPAENMPGIYFMNPKGFKARELLSEEELERIAMDCVYKDDLDENPDQARTREEIIAEVHDTYTLLVKDKEKPILVFDSCIHSGGSLLPVKEILEQAGFKDLRIGAINPADAHSLVKTDFYITKERPEKGCYPFDRDRMIEKTFDHVYSKKSEIDHRVEAARQLRMEIKRIVSESLVDLQKNPAK